MTVSQFIIDFGIEALMRQEIEGKESRIVIDKEDIEFHSLKNEDWNGSKDRLDSYHKKGAYRFYAMDVNGMCQWVYPSTKIETVKTL